MMRTAILVMAFALGGCSTMAPLEDLERQAFLTGDWSSVEARERMQVRQNMRRGLQCPNGYMGYCSVEFGGERCTCVEREFVRVVLSKR